MWFCVAGSKDGFADRFSFFLERLYMEKGRHASVHEAFCNTVNLVPCFHVVPCLL